MPCTTTTCSPSVSLPPPQPESSVAGASALALSVNSRRVSVGMALRLCPHGSLRATGGSAGRSAIYDGLALGVGSGGACSRRDRAGGSRSRQIAMRTPRSRSPPKSRHIWESPTSSSVWRDSPLPHRFGRAEEPGRFAMTADVAGPDATPDGTREGSLRSLASYDAAAVCSGLSALSIAERSSSGRVWPCDEIACSTAAFSTSSRSPASRQGVENGDLLLVK